MVLAGSMAMTAMPITASATISELWYSRDGIGVEVTSDLDKIIAGTTTNEDITSHLNENNLWAVYSYDNNDNSKLTAVSGKDLSTTLNEIKESAENYKVQIQNKHDLLVTDKDPSSSNTTLYVNDKVQKDTFPISVSDIAGECGYDDPLKELKSWTAWYHTVSGNTVYSSNVKKIGDYSLSTYPNITADVVSTVYTDCSYKYDAYSYGSTIIQLDSEYKTFELLVYDGWGKPTADTISVTNDSTGDLGLTGKYKLVYGDDVSGDITTKDGLWSAIEAVAADKDEFDETKAKLVRYVEYSVRERSFIAGDSNFIGSFSSTDLSDPDFSSDALTYLKNNSEAGNIIWRVSLNRNFEYTDDVMGYVDDVLKSYDDYSVTLTNMSKLSVINEQPETGKKPNEFKEFNVDKYPVNAADIAKWFTAEKKPTAGKKYDTENWQIWGAYTYSGYPSSAKTQVENVSDRIDIDVYKASPDYGLFVYFPETELTASITAAAPVILETPAATAEVPENDGYTVTAVSWSLDGTPLTSGEKFKGETQYTLEVTLKADEGLEFISTTPAEINGEAADTTLNSDGTLTVSYTFEKTAKAQVTSIEISALPTKTTYLIGDKLDVTGGKIKVYYEDGETETVDMTAAMVSGFDSTKEGTQTLTVTYGGKTAAFTVTVEKGEVKIEPSDGNVGGAVIDMPIEELMGAILDAEDLELIAQGVDISILMATVTIDPEYVPEADKTAIDNALGDFSVGCYLDVKLFKKYSNGNPDKQVTDPNAPITISFVVPQYIIDQYPEDEYVYSVFCSHNGVGYPVQCRYDAATNTMSFTSDKFSTYALGVKPYAEYSITSADSHVTVENSANEGDTVTIIVENGYTATVTDADGNVIASITGTGSFTMPASNVTITCGKIINPEAPKPIVYFSIFTDRHVSVDSAKHKAGDIVNYRVDDFYEAVVYVNGKASGKISGSGSFTMPAADVRIVSSMDEISYAMFTSSVVNSYVFSYDSDMNPIKTSGTRKSSDYIIIDLGEEYAGRTITIYKGRKSTKTEVAEGVLDENGQFKFENAGFGSNYTLIVSD